MQTRSFTGSLSFLTVRVESSSYGRGHMARNIFSIYRLSLYRKFAESRDINVINALPRSPFLYQVCVPLLAAVCFYFQLPSCDSLQRGVLGLLESPGSQTQRARRPWRPQTLGPPWPSASAWYWAGKAAPLPVLA